MSKTICFSNFVLPYLVTSFVHLDKKNYTDVHIDNLFSDFVLAYPATGFVPSLFGSNSFGTSFIPCQADGNNNVVHSYAYVDNMTDYNDAIDTHDSVNTSDGSVVNSDNSPIVLVPNNSSVDINHSDSFVSLRRTSRSHCAPVFLQDSHCNFLLHSSS